MDWLDIALAIFLALAALLGLSQGLVKMVLPVIGLLVGVIVAGRYYDALAHRIFSSHSATAYVIAFVLIVVVFLIAAVILAYVLHKMLSLVLLGWIDRLLGGILCLVVGSLFAGAVLALLLKYSLAVPAVKESAVASFLVNKFPLALSFMPGDFNGVKDFFRH
jgi:membrane protein required for colicin V production